MGYQVSACLCNMGRGKFNEVFTVERRITRSDCGDADSIPAGKGREPEGGPWCSRIALGFWFWLYCYWSPSYLSESLGRFGLPRDELVAEVLLYSYKASLQSKSEVVRAGSYVVKAKLSLRAAKVPKAMNQQSSHLRTSTQLPTANTFMLRILTCFTLQSIVVGSSCFCPTISTISAQHYYIGLIPFIGSLLRH